MAWRAVDFIFGAKCTILRGFERRLVLYSQHILEPAPRQAGLEVRQVPIYDHVISHAGILQ